MKYQGNTDGYRGGYDASMHVDDAVYPTQWGYVPLNTPPAGDPQPNPTNARRPTLAGNKEGIMDSGPGKIGGEL